MLSFMNMYWCVLVEWKSSTYTPSDKSSYHIRSITEVYIFKLQNRKVTIFTKSIPYDAGRYISNFHLFEEIIVQNVVSLYEYYVF